MCHLCHGMGICSSTQTVLSGWKCSGDVPTSTDVCTAASTSAWGGATCFNGSPSSIEIDTYEAGGSLSSSIGSLLYLTTLSFTSSFTGIKILAGLKALSVYVSLHSL
jgi:hypothetical protein